MLEMGDVFDQLAFQGMKDKDLIAVVATTVWENRKTKHDTAGYICWPTRKDIEVHVEELVRKYGKLGTMSRKNFISAVNKEMIKRERKKAKKEGLGLYFFK